MCELRCASYARSRSLYLHAPHARAPRYVVRAAGETPPKRTPSASSATRLRHGCSCLRGGSHSSTPRAVSSCWTTRHRVVEHEVAAPLRRVPRSHLQLPPGRGGPRPELETGARIASALAGPHWGMRSQQVGPTLASGWRRTTPATPPEGSIAAGDDIGTLEALEELGVATE